MVQLFGRQALPDAFDRIGQAAVANGTMLDIAVYGGSSLMFASNFWFATEDVDMAALDAPWPAWLSDTVSDLARQNGWSPDWLNDAVQFHLSELADRMSDHVEFGTFPAVGEPGLRVSVPSLDYMIALKLKAMRITDPIKGEQEIRDIRALLRARRLTSIDAALALLARFFPKSAEQPKRERFFSSIFGRRTAMARPLTLCEAAQRISQGIPIEIAVSEFLDTFYGASKAEREIMMEVAPGELGDRRTDALLGAIAEYLAKRYRLTNLPDWTGQPCRFLEEPWFTAPSEDAGMREFLTFSSPAEFSHRNIFTEAVPLRRASQQQERD